MWRQEKHHLVGDMSTAFPLRSLGLADITTRRCLNSVGWDSTWVNLTTNTMIDGGKIPMYQNNDDDGNLICSFRYLDAIICLDRTKREDQIKWILSGKGDEFGLTEIQKTSGQHYVTVNGNEFMAFDNNNRDGQTEIRTYILDVPNKRTKLVQSLGFSNKFSEAGGSVQKINDQLYVIGWGWATTDNECMSVLDISTGNKLMSVTLEDPDNITYRCIYYE